jgi:hypothetical protein
MGGYCNIEQIFTGGGGEMMMRVALIHVYSRRERERKRETE